jgi:hypothetical protein
MNCAKRCVALGLLVAAKFQGVAQPTESYAAPQEYYPAFYRPAAYPKAEFTMVIFPRDRKQTSIEVPFFLELSAYASGGTAMYALASRGSPVCLQKIEFTPIRVTRVACPTGLNAALNFAVSASEDRLLVSGRIQGDTGAHCGVFEVGLPGGKTRQVVAAESCESYSYKNSWTNLSLSPRGDEALAVRGEVLELIDVKRGTTRAIARGILVASWSPDGRWIAAAREHGGTNLIDVIDFKTKRTLTGYDVQWSPDSRYLLRVKQCSFPIAVNGVGTLEVVDISTSKGVAIAGSKCAVDFFGNIGWIRSSVVRPSAARERSAPPNTASGQTNPNVPKALRELAR